MRRAVAAALAVLAVSLLAPFASSQDAPGRPPCPRDLRARAMGDGTIVLSWSSAGGATPLVLFRAEGQGVFGPLARLDGDASSYRDEDVRSGTTYRYSLAPEGLDPAACGDVSASSIPYRSGILTALLVSVVGLAGYVAVRARA